MALRYDIGSLASPTRMPNGWLRVDGYLTRVGVFVYRNPDGSERRELRSPAEVFNADSLKSFALVPVTNNHPPELLTAANTNKYAVGTTGENVHQDGDLVRSKLQVTDSLTIADINAGRMQLSCGYEADLEFTPGEWNGERYDAIQRNIRGNHVALVDVGRAGPEARIRLDTDDAIMVVGERRDAVMKILINGVEYEVTDQVAQAINRERVDQSEKLATASKLATDARTEVERTTAKLDATNDLLTKEKQARVDASDPKKFDDRVNARVELLVQARGVLAPEVKLDGKTDHEVRALVVGKLAPEVKLDGKSVEYVQVRFDIALEEFGKKNPGLDAARAAAAGAVVVRVDSGDPDKDSRNRMVLNNVQLGKTPIAGACTK